MSETYESQQDRQVRLDREMHQAFLRNLARQMENRVPARGREEIEHEKWLKEAREYLAENPNTGEYLGADGWIHYGDNVPRMEPRTDRTERPVKWDLMHVEENY